MSCGRLPRFRQTCYFARIVRSRSHRVCDSHRRHNPAPAQQRREFPSRRSTRREKSSNLDSDEGRHAAGREPVLAGRREARRQISRRFSDICHIAKTTGAWRAIGSRCPFSCVADTWARAWISAAPARARAIRPDREYSDQEQQDGLEVIAWLSNQPWSNGTSACSEFPGADSIRSSWRAPNPPALKAIIAVVRHRRAFPRRHPLHRQPDACR